MVITGRMEWWKIGVSKYGKLEKWKTGMMG
jgi:predicted transcriptional regulator